MNNDWTVSWDLEYGWSSHEYTKKSLAYKLMCMLPLTQSVLFADLIWIINVPRKISLPYADVSHTSGRHLTSDTLRSWRDWLPGHTSLVKHQCRSWDTVKVLWVGGGNSPKVQATLSRHWRRQLSAIDTGQNQHKANNGKVVGCYLSNGWYERQCSSTARRPERIACIVRYN